MGCSSSKQKQDNALSQSPATIYRNILDGRIYRSKYEENQKPLQLQTDIANLHKALEVSNVQQKQKIVKKYSKEGLQQSFFLCIYQQGNLEMVNKIILPALKLGTIIQIDYSILQNILNGHQTSYKDFQTKLHAQAQTTNYEDALLWAIKKFNVQLVMQICQQFVKQKATQQRFKSQLNNLGTLTLKFVYDLPAANVNFQKRSKVLEYACRKGHHEFIQQLLKSKKIQKEKDMQLIVEVIESFPNKPSLIATANQYNHKNIANILCSYVLQVAGFKKYSFLKNKVKELRKQNV